MAKRSDSPAGIGVVTVFTILILLCLAVFSALTLSSARADAKLSQARADGVSAWYAADTAAAGLAAGFADSQETELETTIPINDLRELYLHLVREDDGSVSVLAWQTRLTGSEQTDSGPELWDGTDGLTLP